MISDSVKFFNENLREGRYFFIDILKEGILLYDSGRSRLEEPKELTVEQRLKLSEEYFESWSAKVTDFFENYAFSFNNGKYSIAAFLLHQTTEHLYSTILLVLTTYKPRGHDLRITENWPRAWTLYSTLFSRPIPQSTSACSSC